MPFHHHSVVHILSSSEHSPAMLRALNHIGISRAGLPHLKHTGAILSSVSASQLPGVHASVDASEPRRAHPSRATVAGRRNMVGTLEYMAPEVLLKAPGSFASDVYAFAVAVNEIASGVFPFSDCTRDNPKAFTILDMGYGRFSPTFCSYFHLPPRVRVCPLTDCVFTANLSTIVRRLTSMGTQCVVPEAIRHHLQSDPFPHASAMPVFGEDRSVQLCRG